MAIKVVNPGLSTTVQDLGRPGYYPSRHPDRRAAWTGWPCARQLLVGNDEGAAGPRSRLHRSRTRVRLGSTVAVDRGRIADQGRRRRAARLDLVSHQEGQTLAFGYLKCGARIYIAVSGGIDVPLALGVALDLHRSARSAASRAAHSRRRRMPIGAGRRALQGRAVAPKLRRAPASPPNCASCPDSTGIASRNPQAGISSRTPGRWRPRRIAWAIDSAAARPLEFVPREQPFGAGSDPSNIVDACYPYGSIQVPGGTEPIVLHRDAVSGGGYFMIGTVISADIDLIGQLQPHAGVSFASVTMEQALAARHDRQRLLNEICETL